MKEHALRPPGSDPDPAATARARRNLARNRPPLRGIPAGRVLRAQAAFSSFDDARDAGGFIAAGGHIVRSLHTPRPYLHLMSSLHPGLRGVYGSFWDQTGRGFSCLDSVLAGPVTSHGDTSYVPTCPADGDARAFHLCEWARGAAPRRGARPADAWFVLPQPGREEERYSDFQCDQRPGEVMFLATSRGIAATLHAYVAAADPVEVWTITLRNLARRPRRLSLFSRVNWGLRSYPGYYFDMRVVCGGLFDPRRNAVAAFNNDQNNRHPRSGVLMSDTPPAGYDLSREAFDGDGAFRAFPRAVQEGRCRNSLGRAPLAGMIGALQHDFTLPPRGRRVLRLLLGAASAVPAEAARQRALWFRRYLAGNGAARGLEQVRRAWRLRCSANMVKTGDAEVDRFFNVWSKLQAHHQSRFVRALDMVGYRDVLQDLMGVCDFDAGFVRGALLEALSYQLPDGRAIRQYCRFPGAAHDLRMYMDSPLWIADTLVTYVQETGDFRVLDEPVGFFSMPASRARPAGARSVWDHAMLAVRSCFAFRGRKGLCLAGHGDWNDALDGIGRGGRGVSVWLTLAVAFAAGRLAELARRAGRRGDEAALRAMRRTLIGAVNRGAWDGAYYVYGFNDAGEPIGSRRNAEGRIHLNVNTWAILSGAASATGADRTASVLRSIGRLRTPLGYLLLAPPYTARSRRVGRIADMLPGLFENGSVYTHGQAFVAAALVSLGKGDEAWEALKMTMTSRTLPALSTTPPHQQSNFTVGRGNEDFGTQYYSNFSGSLDWYRRTLIRIFGVVADFDGLRIVPCPPRLLRSYEVRKRFRGCDYLVKVENRPRRPGAAPSIRVDGVPIRGNLVPLSARRSCRVDVVL